MTKYVLSVDGGGIRGVAPARMLTHLEAALKAAGAPRVVEAFDLFVGTSTGALVTAALAASTEPTVAKYADPNEIVKIYSDRGEEIFGKQGPWAAIRNLLRQKHSARPLEGILKEVFGDLSLGQLKRNLLATFYSMHPGDPRAVFAHGGPAYPANGRGRDYGDLLVREVVRASSAAPTYFNPAEVHGAAGVLKHLGIDGGLFANNPALCAYVEARKIFPDEEIVVVSLGCGKAKTSYPSNIRTWGLFEWIAPKEGVPLLKAVMHGQTDSVDHQMRVLLNGPEGDAFYRFEFPLDDVSKGLDDASPANIARLISAADKAIIDGADDLRALAARRAEPAPAKPRPQPVG